MACDGTCDQPVCAAREDAPKGRPSSTDIALRDVRDERARQDERWGVQAHHPLAWLAILAEEFGEVAQLVTEGCVPPEGRLERGALRGELIQVAAVAGAWVEAIDRGTEAAQARAKQYVDELAAELGVKRPARPPVPPKHPDHRPQA